MIHIVLVSSAQSKPVQHRKKPTTTNSPTSKGNSTPSKKTNIQGKNTTNNTNSPKLRSSNKEVFTINGISFNMIRIEGGTYTMGATSEQGGDGENSERPIHQVTLSTFYIGETEVTQALWKAVMGENHSNWKGNTLPVESVNWYECQQFIDKIKEITGQNFRFPTEAEWEYAARGGNKSHHTKYSGSNNANAVAWHSGNSNNRTHPVKNKAPNELGLYDMSGNVDEWCMDWYGDYNSESQINPIEHSQGRFKVLRGGTFLFDEKNCRVSARSNNVPGYWDFYPGLRLALTK